MNRMSDRQSVGANAVVANVLTGKLHEFLSNRSLVRVYATGAAVGLNYTVLIGGVAVCQDQEVSAANRYPILPDDFLVEAIGFPGDRIVVSVRNTTGAAITAFTAIDVQPV